MKVVFTQKEKSFLYAATSHAAKLIKDRRSAKKFERIKNKFTQNATESTLTRGQAAILIWVAQRIEAVVDKDEQKQVVKDILAKLERKKDDPSKTN